MDGGETASVDVHVPTSSDTESLFVEIAIVRHGASHPIRTNKYRNRRTPVAAHYSRARLIEQYSSSRSEQVLPRNLEILKDVIGRQLIFVKQAKCAERHPCRSAALHVTIRAT